LNVFDNIVKIVNEIKEFKIQPQDITQMSAFKSLPEFINTNITKDEIDNHLQYFGTKKGEFPNYYFPDKNLFMILSLHDTDKIRYRLYNITYNENIYVIFPQPYNNIILNDKYSPPIKNIFNTIVSTLNRIENIYMVSPDRFFHIHVTQINNENYILLTLHVLYEVSNRNNIDPLSIHYNSKTITRYNVNNVNVNQTRKKHSFYVLFNLSKNEHYLYESKNMDDIYYASPDSIAFKQTIMGDTLIDINYLGGDYNVLVSKLIEKCTNLCS
jgi:hypothetical protein